MKLLRSNDGFYTWPKSGHLFENVSAKCKFMAIEIQMGLILGLNLANRLCEEAGLGWFRVSVNKLISKDTINH